MVIAEGAKRGTPSSARQEGGGEHILEE